MTTTSVLHSPAMERRQLVVATLATAGEHASFTPVQVQKIFFLIDRRGPHLVGGTHFHFEPYDYGPFDNAVYEELERLNRDGQVEIETNGRHKVFSLTDVGVARGREALGALPPATSEFLRATVAWVRGLRFNQLIAAIYREFPDMKVKSIFKQ